jgi:hypothetical protein
VALKNSAKDSIVKLLSQPKGGFIPFDGVPPKDVRAYFDENFVRQGSPTFRTLSLAVTADTGLSLRPARWQPENPV